PSRGTVTEFASFEDYVAYPARLVRLPVWQTAYAGHLQVISHIDVGSTPSIEAALSAGWMDENWNEMSFYHTWIVSMFGEEVVRVFGGLKVVDPDLIPVGLVGLFRSSRMRWEQ